MGMSLGISRTLSLEPLTGRSSVRKPSSDSSVWSCKRLLWAQSCGSRRKAVAAGESRGSEFESIKIIASEAAADGRLSLPPCHRLV